MLCLSRQLNEAIVISTSDGPIIVGLVGHTTQGQIKIGVVAPPEVPVHRAEIHAAIHGGDVVSMKDYVR